MLTAKYSDLHIENSKSHNKGDIILLFNSTVTVSRCECWNRGGESIFSSPQKFIKFSWLIVKLL